MGKRLSPLHTPEQLYQYMRDTGEYPDVDRGTGRTTIAVLRVLTSALSNPYQVCEYYDHHIKATLASYRVIEEVLREKIAALGLRAVYTRSLLDVKAGACLQIIFGKPSTALGAEGWREVTYGV